MPGKTELLVCQTFDPARGFFDPQNPQEPKARHQNKTNQDRMPVNLRPRVKAWEARQ